MKHPLFFWMKIFHRPTSTNTHNVCTHSFWNIWMKPILQQTDLLLILFHGVNKFAYVSFELLEKNCLYGASMKYAPMNMLPWRVI